jgi:hypothetical protein
MPSVTRQLVRLVAASMLPPAERAIYDRLNKIPQRKWTRAMHQKWLVLRRQRLNARADLRTYLLVYLGLELCPRLFEDDDFDDQEEEDYERIAQFLIEFNLRPPRPDPKEWDDSE